MIIERCHRCVGNQACDNQVIVRCLPVPAFGDLTKPHIKVVTIGLNPSLTEFIFKDKANIEKTRDRSVRLSMLEDYGRESRVELSDADVTEAKARRENYFQDKKRDWHPYFEKLESILNRVNPAWTYAAGSAAHVDIVACSTKDSWGFLSKNKPDAIQQIITNCSEYFSKSISDLPDGTVLLCDGRRALAELANLAKRIGKLEMKESIRLDEHGDIVMCWDIKLREKTFRVRGWTIQANYLTSIMRFELSCRVRESLYPA